MYWIALNNNVRCQIILNGDEPTTMDTYYTRASMVDHAFKMANIRSAFSKLQKEDEETAKEVPTTGQPLPPEKSTKVNLWMLTQS